MAIQNTITTINAFSLTYDKEHKLNYKPNEKTPVTPAITSDSLKSHYRGTIEQIADEIVTSHTFCLVKLNPASNYSRKERGNNFLECSIFYVDIDNDNGLPHMNVEQAIERSKELGLIPNIVYYTHSHKKKENNFIHKFRILFFLNNVTTDYNTARVLQAKLHDLFPEADKACKQLIRMVYSGKEVCHVEANVLNNSQEFCQILLKNTNVQYTYEEQFGDFKLERVYQSVERNTDFDEGTDLEEYKTNLTSYKTNFRTEEDRIEHLCKSKLGRVFYEKQIRIDYPILKAITSQCVYWVGGKQMMERIMKEANQNPNLVDMQGNKSKYKSKHFAQVRSYYKKYKEGEPYFPSNLQNPDNNPYYKEEPFKNLLKKIIIEKYKVEDLNTEEQMSMDDFMQVKDKLLDKYFPNKNTDLFDNLPSSSITATPKPINVIGLPTGAGKTMHLRNSQPITIGFPSHRLKNNICEDFQSSVTTKDENGNKITMPPLVEGVDFIVTPEYPQFDEGPVDLRFNDFKELGLFTEASNAIKAISEHKNPFDDLDYTPTEQNVLDALYYREKNMDCVESSLTILTTQSRANVGDFTYHDTIVYDECPFEQNVFLKQYKIEIPHLKRFFSTEYGELFKRIESFLGDVPENKYIDITMNDTDRKVINTSEFKTFCLINDLKQLYMLLTSDIIKAEEYKKVPKYTFCKMNRFNMNKTNYILSASPLLFLYKSLFNEDELNIEIIDNVKHKGTIIQYPINTSRSGINNLNKKDWELVHKICENKPVISFMDSTEKVAKTENVKQNLAKLDIQTEMYLGNTAGHNNLTGKDIVVFGTFVPPAELVFACAKFMGHDFNMDEHKLEYIVVERDKRKFKTYTYRNPILQDIHLSYTEAMHTQAVGRARALYQDCNVVLLSTIPIPMKCERPKTPEELFKLLEKNDNSMTKLPQTKRTFANI